MIMIDVNGERMSMIKTMITILLNFAFFENNFFANILFHFDIILSCLSVVPCLMWLISRQVKITHLLIFVTRFQMIVVDSRQCQGFPTIVSRDMEKI